MKKSILIITQVVDNQDSNLGFFCGWLNEFALQCEKVYVIANKVGEYCLPDNVIVLSLGKEKGVGRIGKIINLWKYMLEYLPKVDGVLAHMCPEYILAGGFLARIFGKPLGLWYLHRSKTLKLVLANILVNRVFTAHADGYPIKTKKLIVTGHGIDLSLFKNLNRQTNDKLRILTIGRISESKDLLILAKSAILIAEKLSQPIIFFVVGEDYLEKDKKYFYGIKKYIKEQRAESIFEFIGAVLYSDVYKYYENADIFLNASHTGGVDKSVLEAMASGLPVVTSNQAFKNILPRDCLFLEGDLNDLVTKILNYKNINIQELKNIIFKNHSLENTAKKIINNLYE